MASKRSVLSSLGLLFLVLSSVTAHAPVHSANSAIASAAMRADEFTLPSAHGMPEGLQRLLSVLARHSKLRSGAGYRSQSMCDEPHVNPPSFLDLSKYTPIEQTVFGVVAVLLEDLGSELQALIKGTPSDSCSTCFCLVVGAAEDLYKTAGEFKNMIEDFSMSKARTALGDLGGLARKIESALHPCGLSEQKTEELIAAAAAWLTGLEEVVEVIELAIKGFKIYCEADALVTAWQQEDWFNVGINIGRLVNVAVSIAEGGLFFTRSPPPAAPLPAHSAAVPAAAPALIWSPDSCVLRRTGGGWETCECGSPLDPKLHFGNYCTPVKTYIDSVAPRGTASGGGLSGGALAGIIVASAMIGAVGFIAGFTVAMRKREQRRVQELSETFISHDERL